MMDLDHFKYINDHYGHVTGDRILKRFAEVTNAFICESSLFARFGGDEFVIVTKEISIAEITNSINSLKNILYEDELLKKYNIDISYGISVMDDSIDDLLILIEKADIELYKNKETK